MCTFLMQVHNLQSCPDCSVTALFTLKFSLALILCILSGSIFVIGVAFGSVDGSHILMK